MKRQLGTSSASAFLQAASADTGSQSCIGQASCIRAPETSLIIHYQPDMQAIQLSWVQHLGLSVTLNGVTTQYLLHIIYRGAMYATGASAY